MKTYIAHYKPLIQRKENLDKFLSAAFYDNFSFVVDEPNDEFIKKNYCLFSAPEISPVTAWEERTKCLDYGSVINYRSLSDAEISLLYKHFLIFSKIAESSEDFALVLEDDVVFGANFKQELDSAIKNTPEQWDFIFMGSGCGLRVEPNKIKEGKISYLKRHPAGKCTDSFLIKKSAAKKILSTLFPFVLPIDFELNYHMMKHDMKVYWIEPPFVFQGSQIGLYSSEIN